MQRTVERKQPLWKRTWPSLERCGKSTETGRNFEAWCDHTGLVRLLLTITAKLGRLRGQESDPDVRFGLMLIRCEFDTRSKATTAWNCLQRKLSSNWRVKSSRRSRACGCSGFKMVCFGQQHMTAIQWRNKRPSTLRPHRNIFPTFENKGYRVEEPSCTSVRVLRQVIYQQHSKWDIVKNDIRET